MNREVLNQINEELQMLNEGPINTEYSTLRNGTFEKQSQLNNLINLSGNKDPSSPFEGRSILKWTKDDTNWDEAWKLAQAGQLTDKAGAASSGQKQYIIKVKNLFKQEQGNETKIPDGYVVIEKNGLQNEKTRTGFLSTLAHKIPIIGNNILKSKFDFNDASFKVVPDRNQATVFTEEGKNDFKAKVVNSYKSNPSKESSDNKAIPYVYKNSGSEITRFDDEQIQQTASAQVQNGANLDFLAKLYTILRISDKNNIDDLGVTDDASVETKYKVFDPKGTILPNILKADTLTKSIIWTLISKIQEVNTDPQFITDTWNTINELRGANVLTWETLYNSKGFVSNLVLKGVLNKAENKTAYLKFINEIENKNFHFTQKIENLLKDNYGRDTIAKCILFTNINGGEPTTTAFLDNLKKFNEGTIQADEIGKAPDTSMSKVQDYSKLELRRIDQAQEYIKQLGQENYERIETPDIQFNYTDLDGDMVGSKNIKFNYDENNSDQDYLTYVADINEHNFFEKQRIEFKDKNGYGANATVKLDKANILNKEHLGEYFKIAEDNKGDTQLEAIKNIKVKKIILRINQTNKDKLILTKVTLQDVRELTPDEVNFVSKNKEQKPEQKKTIEQPKEESSNVFTTQAYRNDTTETQYYKISDDLAYTLRSGKTPENADPVKDLRYIIKVNGTWIPLKSENSEVAGGKTLVQAYADAKGIKLPTQQELIDKLKTPKEETKPETKGEEESPMEEP